MCESEPNGAGLSIRRMDEGDADALYGVLSDTEIMKYLEPPYSREATVQFLHDAGICEPPLVWAVDDARGRFIGYVIYHKYDEHSMELGWVLARNEWGKGYAGALNKMLIEQARKAGMDAVIECSPEQAATKAIAEKHGFTYCGMDSGCEVYRLKLRAE